MSKRDTDSLTMHLHARSCYIVRHETYLMKKLHQMFFKMRTTLQAHIVNILDDAQGFSLEKSLSGVVRTEMREIESWISNVLSDAHLNEVDFWHRVTGLHPIKTSFVVIPSGLTLFGKSIISYDSWFEDVTASMLKSIVDRIKMSITLGENKFDIVADVCGRDLKQTSMVDGSYTRTFVGGVIITTRNKLEAIIRTSLYHTIDKTRILVFQENEDTFDNVISVNNFETLQKKCIRSHNKKWPIAMIGQKDSDFIMNPRHWNCRSLHYPEYVAHRQFSMSDIADWFNGLEHKFKLKIIPNESRHKNVKNRKALLRELQRSQMIKSLVSDINNKLR